MLPRVDQRKKASNIIQELDIFKAIYWPKSAWKNVYTDTIKHCFQKCGSKDVTVNPPEDHYIDEEFKGSFAELSAGWRERFFNPNKARLFEGSFSGGNQFDPLSYFKKYLSNINITLYNC